MSGTMAARDLFWGRTDNKGKLTINHSRVWDAERFLKARREEGARAKDDADKFTVSVHTEQEFKEQRL